MLCSTIGGNDVWAMEAHILMRETCEDYTPHAKQQNDHY